MIRQPTHLSQGMAFRNPLFGRDLGEKGPSPLLLAAHPISAVEPFSLGWLGFAAAS